MNFKQTLRFWWQRRTRGWDDSETWSLDTALAKWLAPRLRRFKKLTIGIPVEYFPNEETATEKDEKEANAAWHADLDKMIAAFEWCSDERKYSKLAPPVVQEGLELFAKRFHNLWW